MTKYIIKKLLLHFSICLVGWLLVLLLGGEGKLYAGWLVGFLGACYLLAGWIVFLKGKGTDLAKLIRRKRPPEVPYYLRNSSKGRKTRQGFTGARHVFDDDFEDDKSNCDDADYLSKPQRIRCDAIALAVNGAMLFILSAI